MMQAIKSTAFYDSDTTHKNPFSRLKSNEYFVSAQQSKIIYMAYRGKQVTNPVTGQQITFLQTASDTNGRYLEMQSTYDSFSRKPTPHYHPHQTEYFEVLSGELTVCLNNKTQVLKPGNRLCIPPNTPHSMWNNHSEKTMINWKVEPAMHTEQLLETVFGLAADGRIDGEGKPLLLQSALLMNKFAGEFRLAKPPYRIQKIIFGLLTPVAYFLGYRNFYEKYMDAGRLQLEQ